MNQKYYLLAILVLLIAFTVLYVEKPSGYQQQTERLESVIREGKREADSLRSSLLNAIDTIEVQRLIIANAHEATERAREVAVKAQSRNSKTRAQVAELQTVIDSLAKKDTIVHILNVAYQACDSLQEAQAEELRAQGEELIANQAGLKTALNALETSIKESDKLRQVIIDNEKLSIEREKQARKRGFKRGLICGIGLGIIALLL